jgi:hypothetical protein
MSIEFKVQFSAKTTLDKLKGVRNQLAKLPVDSYNYWVSITPVDTGNARRNTTLRGSDIRADYPYAQRLDTGWSKQYGGKGMTEPTKKYIRDRVRQITGQQLTGKK